MSDETGLPDPTGVEDECPYCGELIGRGEPYSRKFRGCGDEFLFITYWHRSCSKEFYSGFETVVPDE